MAKKTTEAQARASKKWDESNKERKRYIVKRSTAKSFITTCEIEDLDELERLIAERRSKI